YVFLICILLPFCQEYRRGRTPNPCIRCNRYIKFGTLREKAGELGAGLVASGHYARVEKSGGRYLLKKGLDRRKDQSYMLYTLSQEQLENTLLPIGNFTKERVREIAGELALPAAARPESQEICFIPDDDYPGFLKEYMPQAVVPGPILDKQGNTLGEHRGILFYTVGQRKRLGISAKEPRYVTAILPEENAIVVGGREELYGNELVASGLNWIALAGLEKPVSAQARIRYQHHEAAAEITPLAEDRVRVRFAEPQMAITSGQAVVFYHGDIVLGGGTIERAG
ncbi:tRNA 2-thiouridine(34) synthase MnmA, partial [Chloroflexota bacterium]